MSWHLVGDVPLPDAVGGHPALDFCNTRAGWSDPAPKEYLTSPRALALWALDADLLPAAGDGEDPGATDDLRRALALRDALYPCLLGHGTDADWALVSGEVVASRAVSRLRAGEDGVARWALDGAADLPPARAALHVVAGSAETLLTSPLAGCVSACPGAGCGWLFADPRRRRRWCSMAVCGNRAKARRHAERRHDR
jgi:predicted RNA-binding Zn ribbon-like protein